MLDETLEWLAVRPDGTYLDATFGAGGHARAIAARLGTGGRLIALDRDPSVASLASGIAPLDFASANFADLESVLDERGIAGVDGVLFDFGVSSMQFDRPERGFSLQADGPLDMRMDPARGESAYELLARADEAELADIIFSYGEDRAARRIARALIRAREAGRLPQTTLALAGLVAGVVHVRGRRERLHPATRTFQALRIAVNGELTAIERGLAAAAGRLNPGGRIVAISFHSLEDRVVKNTFRSNAALHALVKRPLAAGEAEVAQNPRARSAKLRVAERAS